MRVRRAWVSCLGRDCESIDGREHRTDTHGRNNSDWLCWTTQLERRHEHLCQLSPSSSSSSSSSEMTSVGIYLSVLGLLLWSTCLADARPSFSRIARQRLVNALRARRTVRIYPFHFFSGFPVFSLSLSLSLSLCRNV